MRGGSGLGGFELEQALKHYSKNPADSLKLRIQSKTMQKS
jgi:hypothetical protein